MKPGLWFAGVVAALVVGGSLWYLRRLREDVSGVLKIVDDENALKSYGSISLDAEDEIDGLNFIC
jgi:hypothetical protein